MKKRNNLESVSPDFSEAIYVLPERVIEEEFERRIQIEIAKLGDLDEKALLNMQERVKLLIEIREDFISTRNQKPTK